MSRAITFTTFPIMLWASAGCAEEPKDAQQSFAVFDECQLTGGQTLAPCKVGYRPVRACT